jgi:hypothetical protein
MYMDGQRYIKLSPNDAEYITHAGVTDDLSHIK